MFNQMTEKSRLGRKEKNKQKIANMFLITAHSLHHVFFLPCVYIILKLSMFFFFKFLQKGIVRIMFTVTVVALGLATC